MSVKTHQDLNTSGMYLCSPLKLFWSYLVIWMQWWQIKCHSAVFISSWFCHRWNGCVLIRYHFGTGWLTKLLHLPLSKKALFIKWLVTNQNVTEMNYELSNEESEACAWYDHIYASLGTETCAQQVNSVVYINFKGYLSSTKQFSS